MLAGESHPTVGGSPFPSIADYGFLSDCEVAVLVAPSGSIEWMCLPRLDGPSIFAALLDRDAGSFRLGPADVSVPATRRYLPGTMVRAPATPLRARGTARRSSPGAVRKSAAVRT